MDDVEEAHHRWEYGYVEPVDVSFDPEWPAYCEVLECHSILKHQPFKYPLLENLVVMELVKQSGWSRTRVSLHHFRTPPGREGGERFLLICERSPGRIAVARDGLRRYPRPLALLRNMPRFV